MTIKKALFGAALLAACSVQASELKLYLSQPGLGPANETVPAGALPWPAADIPTHGSYALEDFNGKTIAATGRWAVGDYATVGGAILGYGIWGGADGNAVADSRYLTPGTHVTITLDQPSRYVGFWWSAGSGGNRMLLLDQNDNVLVDMNTNDLNAFLNASTTLNAVDGATTYAKTRYHGNPFPPNKLNAQTTPWPYAYLNFVLNDTSGAGSTAIRKVRFEGGGSFEIDNVAVREAAPTGVPGSWVDTGIEIDVIDPPSTRDDAYQTPRNQPTGPLALLGNDPYVPAGSTTTVQGTSAQGGTITAGPGANRWTYTPPRNFVGTDTFTYTVCLAEPHQTLCSTSTITITVAAAAPAPVPALGLAGLLGLSGLLASAGMLLRRRRQGE